MNEEVAPEGLGLWDLYGDELKTLRESRVILSMSGGKDSTACALLLEKHGIEFEAVFMDTGWEHPIVYEYIKTVLEPRFGKVRVLRSERYPGGMPELVRARTFPDRRKRFCTSELKIKPFKAFIDAQGTDEQIVNVIGIRRQESASRSNARRWEYSEQIDAELFRPLVRHTFDDVIRMHQEGGIAPNPLYLQGAQRVGCFPCIFSRKSEIRAVADLFPERIDEIEELEREVQENVRARRLEDANTTLLRNAWRLSFDEINRKRDAIGGAKGDQARRRLRWGEFLTWAEAHTFRITEPEVEHHLGEAHSRRTVTADEHRAFVKTMGECLGGEREDEMEQIFTDSTALTFFGGRLHGGTKLPIRELAQWARTSHGGKQTEMFELTAVDGCVRWGMCESPLSDRELVKIREGSRGKAPSLGQ